MMSEPMSEERLAELRANVERAEENTKWYGPLGYAGEMERDCLNEIDRLRAENERLGSWVSDIQSGMYVNCVYCGHRYGPGETTPVSMADALKAHVEQCPKHPMSALKAEVERLREAGQRAWDFAVFVHFHEEAAKHGDECDLPLEASILADLMARTLQPEMFE